MIRLPPRSTRTDTLFPYTTLFRSDLAFRQSCGVDRRGLLHDSIVDPAARGRLLPLDVPWPLCRGGGADDAAKGRSLRTTRSEEHTSELQSLMRISYAVFCLKKKNTNKQPNNCNQATHQKHAH